jgi:pilus assembly protein CpaB
MNNTIESPSRKVVSRIRFRAMAFLALALILGAAAVAVVKVYMERAAEEASARPSATTPVVVAAVDLPVATLVSQDNVKVVQWPTGHEPDGAFGTVEAVLGKTINQKVVRDEPLLPGRLAASDRGRGLAALLSEGNRAMAVKVDQVVGIAGFVQPGDFVDVITTMRPDQTIVLRRPETRPPAMISKIVLQDIKVLAVGEKLWTDGRKPVTVQVVTLEVTPEQSERLALASEHGTIQLTMRSRVDQVEIPTAGVTPEALLASDEGAAVPVPVAVAAPPAKEPRSARTRRRSRRERRTKVEAVEVVAPPAAPEVEILRGRNIERRTLQPSADSQPARGG